MGGASSMWYKKNHRKVLILSYDDSYSNSN